MSQDRGGGDSFASLFESASRSARPKPRIAVGETLEVVVVKVGRDAVFVDLDGKQEGFVERELLEGEDGAPIVAVGSRLTARIVELGGKQGAARLEPVRVRGPEGAVAVAAATETGPVLTVGARVKGPITGIERYGVFLKLGPKQRGLVPVSELGAPRGADLKKLFTVGQELEAKLVAIDEQGRLRLSVSALASDEERNQFEAFQKPAEKEAERKPRASFGTLADLLGNVKVAPPPKAAPAKAAPPSAKPAARVESAPKPTEPAAPAAPATPSAPRPSQPTSRPGIRRR